MTSKTDKIESLLLEIKILRRELKTAKVIVERCSYCNTCCKFKTHEKLIEDFLDRNQDGKR